MQTSSDQVVEVATSSSKPPLVVVMPTSSTEHSAVELEPLTAAVKRKRTKRPRHHHPPPAASSSSDSESTTTEEEDMAHCLILLAQGAGGDSKPPQPPPAVKSERYTSRKYTADGVKAGGFYVYECKTCNKCFPTFQALGGHRASHKKPRLAGAGADDEMIASNVVTAAATKPPPPPPLKIDVAAVFPDVHVTTALSLNSIAICSSSSRLRVHECSICGAEFASGQALGGHMRRHRPLNAPERAVTAAAIPNKEGSTTAGINLELDLNLPAPSDEEAPIMSLAAVPVPAPARRPAVVLGLGQFNDGNKAGLMLAASALVDCHY